MELHVGVDSKTPRGTSGGIPGCVLFLHLQANEGFTGFGVLAGTRCPLTMCPLVG